MMEAEMMGSPEVKEIRPFCVPAYKRTEIEVIFEWETSGLCPGIINIVIIDGQDDSMEVTAIAPLSVLPLASAEEMTEIFEKIAYCDMKSSLLSLSDQNDNVTVASKECLFSTDYKLSESQEVAIRQYVWYEQVKPFTLDLELLLNLLEKKSEIAELGAVWSNICNFLMDMSAMETLKFVLETCADHNISWNWDSIPVSSMSGLNRLYEMVNLPLNEQRARSNEEVGEVDLNNEFAPSSQVPVLHRTRNEELGSQNEDDTYPTDDNAADDDGMCFESYETRWEPENVLGNADNEFQLFTDEELACWRPISFDEDVSQYVPSTFDSGIAKSCISLIPEPFCEYVAIANSFESSQDVPASSSSSALPAHGHDKEDPLPSQGRGPTLDHLHVYEASRDPNLTSNEGGQSRENTLPTEVDRHIIEEFRPNRDVPMVNVDVGTIFVIAFLIPVSLILFWMFSEISSLYAELQVSELLFLSFSTVVAIYMLKKIPLSEDFSRKLDSILPYLLILTVIICALECSLLYRQSEEYFSQCLWLIQTSLAVVWILVMTNSRSSTLWSLFQKCFVFIDVVVMLFVISLHYYNGFGIHGNCLTVFTISFIREISSFLLSYKNGKKTSDHSTKKLS